MEEKYTNFWQNGVYKCGKCGSPLICSSDKFKSTTAWPSFRDATAGAIKTRPDYSLGVARTEVLCAKCGQHLGHLFDDGKILGDSHSKAGNRYCILSNVLDFKKKNES